MHFGTGFNQMKIICFSQGTVATFYRCCGYIYIIWCDISSGLHTPKITKIGSFFTELFLKNQVVIAFLKHGVYYTQ